MRALLYFLPVVLASCSTIISQREILKRSQAEIAQRESWSDTAAVLVEQKPDDMLRITWRVRAGAFDFSDFPSYQGINFIPGTERELIFTRDGCLIGYGDHGSRCPTVGTYETTYQEATIPAK